MNSSTGGRYLSWAAAALLLTGCGGGGGADAEPNWYYHFICNGDQACLSTNFAGAPFGTSSQGPGQGGVAGCNGLINFGNINWNIPPAQHWCDNSPGFAAPTVNLAVAPSSVELGQSATLTWSSSMASTCTGSGAWSGSKGTAGSTNVAPAAGGSYTYTLTCNGPGGATARSATLVVNAPAVSISLTPSTIADGQSSTLAWSSTRTTSCTASGAWTDAVALSGSRQVAPSTGSFTYTLTCAGTGGTTVNGSATLTVNPSGSLQSPPTVTISVTPSTVNNTQTSELTWSTTRATSCTAGGSWEGEKPLSGTVVLAAAPQGQYTYSLTCNGSGGSASGVAGRNVTGRSVICGEPTVNLAVSPTTIAEGQAATLSWSATPAPSCSSQFVTCTAAGSWSGDVANSGTLGVAPSAGSFAYVLNCSGRNATVSRSATLTVTASPPPPAPTVDVTLTPDAISLGQSATLRWTTSGVRSCTASGAWTGALGLSGTTTVTPTAVGGYDYTLTCLGSAASAADTATLSVQTAAGTTATARFNYPSAIVLDSAGNLLIADTNNHTLRKITPAGAVTTVAGLAGSAGSTDGTGVTARFNSPHGLAVNAADTVFVTDSSNHTVRAVTPAAAVTTFAGLAGNAGAGDGTGAAARFTFPVGVAADSVGNLYVVDHDNHTIRKITPGGDVTTLAGTAGLAGAADGTGAAARFNGPQGIAVDAADNLYITDYGNFTIRKIAAGTADVTTLAGGSTSNVGNGDGTGAGARFYGPLGIATDSAGNVFVTDINAHTIRKITPAGVVTTFAGSSPGSSDGTGTSAQFRKPAGIASDGSDNLYIADSFNCTVRKATPAGVVTTVAGQALACGSNN